MDGTDEDPHRGGHPFFFDFQPYWAQHLGRVFGTDRANSGAEGGGHLREPNRVPRRRQGSTTRRAGVFGQNGSYPDHRSWPQEEDFTFYSGCIRC